MRKRFEIQLELGATPIEEIKIPIKSRDELPPVIRALQYIYITPEINEKVFKVIEKKINRYKNGRPGLTLWEILVLGVVRLTLDVNLPAGRQVMIGWNLPTGRQAYIKLRFISKRIVRCKK